MPKPAEAQTVIRVCAINQAAFLIRTRFTYTDWQGSSHASRWVNVALGERNCGTLQDLRSLAVEFEYAGLTGWRRPEGGCWDGRVPMKHRENSSFIVTGTIFMIRCAIEH
jgi:hypothetical protein